MNNPQEITLNENEELCEWCENGMRYYPPIYIGGDLYQDGEVMECNECQGTGKTKTINHGEDKRN